MKSIYMEKERLNKIVAVIYGFYLVFTCIKLVLTELSYLSIVIGLIYLLVSSIAYNTVKPINKVILTCFSVTILFCFVFRFIDSLTDFLFYILLLSVTIGLSFKNFYFCMIGHLITIMTFILNFKKEDLLELLILSNLLGLSFILILIQFLNYNKEANHFRDDFLPNQSNAIKKLSELIHQVNSHFAVAVIDLDTLKAVNKKDGYDAGDYILFQVTNRIRQNINKKHLVFRSGGDEFTILFSNVSSKKECLKILNNILLDLRKPFIFNHHRLTISASIGMVFNDQKFSTGEEYLRAASISLEKAKMNGKNRICLFDTLKDEFKIRRFKIEKDLKSSIENHELELYYQPIHQLKTSQIIGLESLIRWNHSELGVISPLEFIPIAESNGFISEIGKFVIKEACKMLSYLDEQLHEELVININISPSQLKDTKLYEVILASLIEFSISPKRLQVEITESGLIDDLEVSKVTLTKLSELGINIHLDDFGTGYSSLSYLHILPIHTLKVDKSFIENLKINSKNYQLLKSIILMGKELTMDVIAEGIEDQTSLNQLIELGCEYGQGYYFSKPLNSTDLMLYFKEKVYFKTAV